VTTSANAVPRRAAPSTVVRLIVPPVPQLDRWARRGPPRLEIRHVCIFDATDDSASRLYEQSGRHLRGAPPRYRPCLDRNLV
jgi:hypothetical protein